MPMPDRFRWRAVYTDGTTLDQVEPDGTKHGYGDIDRTCLAFFELHDWEASHPVFRIRLDYGDRLIWRRRVDMTGGGTVECCHIVGKQNTINGKNRQWIAGVFESDGRMEYADRFKEGDPWFAPVQLRPNEGEDWQLEEGTDGNN